MRPKLAISLNASNDEQRSALMPINKKYPLADLLRVCRAYPLRPWEHLMFEYVMLDGLQRFRRRRAPRRRPAARPARQGQPDSLQQRPGTSLPRPHSSSASLAFQKILMDRRIPTFIRISRGQDIRAACGQLSLAESGQ